MSAKLKKVYDSESDKKRHDKRKSPKLQILLKTLIKYGASDLHLKAERPPIYRISGKMIPAKLPEFSAEEVKELIYSMMTRKQILEFEKRRHIDFSYGLKGVARFRANVYFQRGSVSAAIRLIPLGVPELTTRGLPNVVNEVCMKESGLILVTGNTGSGKSTTLAGMINFMNQTRRLHIVTVEDPIEFIHHDIRSVISQRELGTDTLSLSDALKAALRQDPDVIMMGEMRDTETIMTAMTAAETGHLVLSTMHTIDAKSTIERIVDVVPADMKSQVRIQLATTLTAVFSQKLLKSKEKGKRIVAVEAMIKSPTIERLINTDKIHEIQSAIEESNLYYKMQTMNQALYTLIKEGKVDKEEALRHSLLPEDLQLQLSGFNKGETGEDTDTSENPNLINPVDTEASIRMDHQDYQTDIKKSSEEF
jgi:twitching motility protein PilT